jgi:hypothetical protein
MGFHRHLLLVIRAQCLHEPHYDVAGGTWDEGWQSIGNIRKTGATTGRLDVFFVSPGPASVRLRSIKEALEHLGLHGQGASHGKNSASGLQDGGPKSRGIGFCKDGAILGLCKVHCKS